MINFNPIKRLFARTRIKVFIAALIYLIIRKFLKSPREVCRNQIRYRVDLSEGLDLSIFLFGNFQIQILQAFKRLIQKKSIIIDIGANMGALTLPFAALVPEGKVLAIEPTHYAYHKLLQNIALNPALRERILPIQQFLSDGAESNPPHQIYSSWSLHSNSEARHPIHSGSLKDCSNIKISTLDELLDTQNLPGIDFIKIDTDGHEWFVLNGALKTISHYQPVILFEIGKYLLKEKNIAIHDIADFFSKLSYNLFDLNFKKIEYSNLDKCVPEFSTVDLLAFPTHPKQS